MDADDDRCYANSPRQRVSVNALAKQFDAHRAMVWARLRDVEQARSTVLPPQRPSRP